jgi:hypothetical protein
MRILFLSALLISLSSSAFGADEYLSRNVVAQPEPSNLCERLLRGTLDGVYVVTNQKTNDSSLVRLKSVGGENAYLIAAVRLNLPATGVRELQVERLSDGLNLTPESGVVDLMSIDRRDSHATFRFESAQDAHNRMFVAAPIAPEETYSGVVLSPDHFELRFDDPIGDDFRFTRVRLDDRSFERLSSPSLKSLLATRLHSRNIGNMDYLITVEMQRPMSESEAKELLDVNYAFPIQGDGENSYQFIVPMTVYNFLEQADSWTRLWEVARLDTIPARAINPELLRRIETTTNSRLGPAPTGKLGSSTTPPAAPPKSLGETKAPPPSSAQAPKAAAAAPQPPKDTPPPTAAGGTPKKQVQHDDELGDLESELSAALDDLDNNNKKP